MAQILLLCLLLREIESTVVWKGIRYAEPQKRWMPPEPYQAGFEHARDNRQEKYDSCPQDDLKQSEDCLRLDIYMPDNAKDLPIYIWIHGGHFKHGTGQWYYGSHFVDEDDIVYVSIQVNTLNRLNLLLLCSLRYCLENFREGLVKVSFSIDLGSSVS